MATAPLRLPVAAGVNVTPMLQLLLAARTCPVQVSAANWKSAAFGPDRPIVLMVIAVVPPFVTVASCALLVTPSA
jgi:hypothetical protein